MERGDEMKIVVVLLMMMISINTLTEEVSKEKEQINKENIDYVLEPPMSTQIICGFPICDLTDRKCVVRGFKVDGEKMNEAESYDLKDITNMLNNYVEKGSIDIVGHTDSTGSKKYNLRLSKIRARNVAKLMREYGLDERFSFGKIIGKGEEIPADTNETVEGRYNNRRVEIILNNIEYIPPKFIE